MLKDANTGMELSRKMQKLTLSSSCQSRRQLLTILSFFTWHFMAVLTFGWHQAHKMQDAVFWFSCTG